MNYKECVKSTLTSEWGDNLLELPDGGGGGCSDSGSGGLWVVVVVVI